MGLFDAPAAPFGQADLAQRHGPELRLTAIPY
jgi:hypothetical protein